jgi:DNA damage-binding protein 1
MLYIASVSHPKVEADIIANLQAQPPTPILQSLLVSDFTSPGSSSLVIAKPDRVEVWDVGPAGLVFQADLEVWGSIVGIEKVVVKVCFPLRYDELADDQDARPHLLVLMGPPNAQLLVLTYNPSTSSLIVASSTLLNPPTPSLRLAEFYRGVIVEGSTTLISLWVGVLSCVELEVELEKDLKRRRSSAVRPGMVNESVSDKRLRVRETFNIK